MERLDVICPTPGDRTLVAVVLRGSLLMFAKDCRERAWATDDPDLERELLSEAHHAMSAALRLEAA